MRDKQLRGKERKMNQRFKTKMKKRMVFLVMAVVFPCSLWAEENNDDEVPIGMEVIMVRPGMKQIVPKGTKVSKIGDLIVLEDSNEYSARRFEEMENRFKSLEAKQDAFKKDLEMCSLSLKDAREAINRDMEARFAKIESNLENNKQGLTGRLEKKEIDQEALRKIIDRIIERQDELKDEIERLKDVLIEAREAIEEVKQRK